MKQKVIFAAIVPGGTDRMVVMEERAKEKKRMKLSARELSGDIRNILGKIETAIGCCNKPMNFVGEMETFAGDMVICFKCGICDGELEMEIPRREVLRHGQIKDFKDTLRYLCN